jgi:two-component system chemotaxis sensor kinase CheA
MRIDAEKYRTLFFEEAGELLDELEGDFLRMEEDGINLETINDAFRRVHTIKGGALSLGLTEVSQVSHSLETFLDRWREGTSVRKGELDLCLAARDLLVNLIASAKTGGARPPEFESILASLHPPSPRSAKESLAISSTKLYRLSITPHPDSIRNGLNPLQLLKEISEFGKVECVDVDSSRLPAIAELDPERCYLAWEIRIETDRIAEVQGVFEFAPDMVELKVEEWSPTELEDDSGREARPQDQPPAPEPVPTPDPPAVAPMPSQANRSSRAKPIAHSPAPPMPDCMSTCMQKLGEETQRASEFPNEKVPDPLRLATFLFERKVLTAEQALEALNRLRLRRPMLGCLAVEIGVMTVDQMFETLSQMGEGQRFGQTAVRLGFITEAHLGYLFLLQELRTPPMADFLVAEGVISREVMDSELKQFHAIADASDKGQAEYAEVAEPDVPPPPTRDLLEGNLEMIQDFCAEAEEHLESADRHLLTLDGNPTNDEALNAIYRGYHTIKGAASMLGLNAIQVLAHDAENLLNLAREGKVVLTDGLLDLAFESSDGLKRQVRFLRDWLHNRQGPGEDPNLAQLLKNLRATANGKPLPRAKQSRPAAASPQVEPKPEAKPEKPRAESVSRPASAASPHPEVPPVEHPQPARRSQGEKDTLRVDKDRLDKLINSIGELVITQSMAQEEFHRLTFGTGARSRVLPELNKISRDLQELSLSLRMVPIQGTFQKMTRLVRDLSKKIEKPVEFETFGEDTELDKSMVDQLGDPLMHMVRNALDHGLEPPEERVRVGKRKAGSVTLKAYHQGGNVNIELTDDGRGLNRDVILRKAIEKGIVSEGQRLTDSEIYALIFEPGFSTAKAVTDVSGRGVGMDVVRKNVESLQGNILIRTQLGKGTTFTIRLECGQLHPL